MKPSVMVSCVQRRLGLDEDVVSAPLPTKEVGHTSISQQCHSSTSQLCIHIKMQSGRHETNLPPLLGPRKESLTRSLLRPQETTAAQPSFDVCFFCFAWQEEVEAKPSGGGLFGGGLASMRKKRKEEEAKKKEEDAAAKREEELMQWLEEKGT